MAAQAFIYGGIAALQLAGGLFAADNIKKTAQLNQDIANMNAEFAELDAYDAEIDGYSQTAEYQKIVDDTLAEQTLALTAADIDITYGSAASIQSETRFTAQLNKMEIENQANKRALGYEAQARQYRLGGFLQKVEAEGRATSAVIGGITSAAKTGITGYRRGAFGDIGPKYSGDTPNVKSFGVNYSGPSENFA